MIYGQYIMKYDSSICTINKNYGLELWGLGWLYDGCHMRIHLFGIFGISYKCYFEEMMKSVTGVDAILCKQWLGIELDVSFYV